MQKPLLCFLTASISFLLSAACGGSAAHQTGLQVSYGNSGIQKLVFDGVTLEDLDQYGSDAFHIWHMKASDTKGQPLTGAQYGWGENNNGHSWNAATHTWTYNFTWGAIALQFEQAGSTLNMNVSTANNANSGIVFDGATIYPFVLHFPQLPEGFNDPKYGQLAVNTSNAPAPVADFGAGKVTASVSEKTKPVYYGFEPAGGGNNYFPVISTTSMDSMAPTFPHMDRPVPAGGTDTLTVSLKFESSPNH